MDLRYKYYDINHLYTGILSDMGNLYADNSLYDILNYYYYLYLYTGDKEDLKIHDFMNQHNYNPQLSDIEINKLNDLIQHNNIQSLAKFYNNFNPLYKQYIQSYVKMCSA